MTGLIDTLEKDGLVVRQDDTENRRITKVHLTADGRAFIEAMLPDYFECASETISSLAKTERKLLVNLLCKLQEQFDDSAEPNFHSQPLQNNSA